MTVTVNGTPMALDVATTLADIAALVGVADDEPGVAAALDGAVVPRAHWPRTVPGDGSAVEIVRAAAGG